MKQRLLSITAITAMIFSGSVAQEVQINKLSDLSNNKTMEIQIVAQCVVKSSLAADYHSKANQYPHKDKLDRTTRKQFIRLSKSFGEQYALMKELLSSMIVELNVSDEDTFRREVSSVLIAPYFEQEDSFIELWIRGQKPLKVATDRYENQAKNCSEAVIALSSKNKGNADQELEN